MKPIIYSLFIISLFGLIIISCEKNNDNDKKLIITGQLISNSTCKNDLKSSSQVVATPDNLTCVEYSFDKEKSKLTIKHINSGFNCCPDSLYCKVKLKGDTIMIQEFEKSALCKCNCLYDLDIEVNSVEMKNYQIKFIEPYVGEQTKLIFDIDLTKDSNGTFCVTRNQYPWGMNSLNE
jgi:hypothetical protein